MGFFDNLKNLSTDVLSKEGYALCSICKRKFFISDLYSCDYCGKFACKDHVKNGPYGGKICERCAK